MISLESSMGHLLVTPSHNILQKIKGYVVGLIIDGLSNDD